MLGQKNRVLGQAWTGLGQGLDRKMGLLDGFGWCSEVPFSGLSKRLPGSSMIAWATRGTEKKKNQV